MVTGAQLRAARAMLGLTHAEVSRRATEIEPVSLEALRKWEKSAGPVRGIAPKVAAVIAVLEAAGIEFTPDGGVRPKLEKP